MQAIGDPACALPGPGRCAQPLSLSLPSEPREAEIVQRLSIKSDKTVIISLTVTSSILTVDKSCCYCYYYYYYYYSCCCCCCHYYYEW